VLQKALNHDRLPECDSKECEIYSPLQSQLHTGGQELTSSLLTYTFFSLYLWMLLNSVSSQIPLLLGLHLRREGCQLETDSTASCTNLLRILHAPEGLYSTHSVSMQIVVIFCARQYYIRSCSEGMQLTKCSLRMVSNHTVTEL
jgi:hypothetical protein